MYDIWEEFGEVLKNKHLKGSNLKLNQYMKWELKAFVAQIVEFRSKHADTFGKSKELSNFLSNYFAKKEIDIDETHNLIKITSKIICS